MKFPRRQFGLGLLGIGVTGRLILEYLRVRSVREKARFTDKNLASDVNIVDAAYASEVDRTLQEVEFRLQDRVRQIFSKKNRIRVYSGILLTSKENNVLVFRGTQTQAEWLKNLNANQQQYISPIGKAIGEVHEGFFQLTNELTPAISETVQQLDPTILFYITGHSLGAAVATLAALEIAQKVPQLRERIQLYTYASPRVYSPILAQIHSELIPNSYRVVNLGDTVTLVPPVTIGNSYVHIGQEWSFLAQFGDVLLNHVVDTYIAAMEQEAEGIQGAEIVRQLRLG